MIPRTSSIAIYGVAALCLGTIVDAVYGAGPVQHFGLVHIAIVSASLFALACLLTIPNPRWGMMAGSVVIVLSWLEVLPISLSIVRANFLWSLSYRPENVAAVLSLIVASVWSIRSWLRSESQERNSPRQLLVVILYAICTVCLGYWRNVWERLFRLRYGS